MRFIIDSSHESSEGAEVGGTFQIGSVEVAGEGGAESRDATGEADSAVYFSAEEDLKEYLAITFKVSAEEIDFV